jgi:hypothetical protein
MADTLEQVLADERGDAAVLRKNGHGHDADLIERVCDRVSRAAEEYLRFVAEPDARLRTNRSQEYLRARYADWEAQGHAYKKGTMRYYRMLVLPPRANLSAAREEGRRAASA